MRTMFVNPSLYENPRKKRAKKGGKKGGTKRKGKRGSRRRWPRYKMRGRVSLLRLQRNAGIAPFVQANPLIMSNPVKRRRRRRSNPVMPSAKKAVGYALSTAGGAVAAVTANTVALSKIHNAWGRRGAQLATAVVGGMMASRKSAELGAAFAGAMMVPLVQDVAANFLGMGFAAGVAAAKEADIDALAADLEDVLDDMDEDDLGDDDGDFLEDDDEEMAW